MRPLDSSEIIGGRANQHPSHESQISRATQGLRVMLLSGEFRPGDRISEIPVAARLGVSRSPLRVAVEKLQCEGVLEARPKGGFAARGFSIDDIWDALELRGLLEGAAARLAAEHRVTSAQLEPLRKINSKVETILNTDFDGFIDSFSELNRAFHAGIVALAGNKMLTLEIQRINELPFISPDALVLLHKRLPASKNLIPIAQQHHHALVEAIERGQGARAETVAREHSWLTRRNLELARSDWRRVRSFPGANLVALREP